MNRTLWIAVAVGIAAPAEARLRPTFRSRPRPPAVDMPSAAPHNRSGLGVPTAAVGGAAAGAAVKGIADLGAGSRSEAAAAPAAATPASGTAAAKTLAIRVPSGGQYTAYVQEGAGAPKSIQDKGELEYPARPGAFTVYVLDNKSGYAARKTVDPKAAPAELSFASPDFKLVQKVRVQVTGKDNLPIAQGSVALTDGGKNTSRKIIQPTSQGAAEFDFVVAGPGSVVVAPEGGSATTKEVSLDLPKGETVQTIPVALPEVTATVEPAAGSAPAPAGAANTPAANAPVAAPVAQPAPVAPVPVQPAPLRPASDPGPNIIGFIFLAALLGGGYLYMKNKGITVEDLIKKFGVQPDTVATGGGSLAGANMATAVQTPGAPPAPPPVVSDPNQCPYCGQMKDPSGQCACTVTSRGAAPAPGGWNGTPGPAGGGPRLVGVAGAYMGHVFPIHGQAVIGREASNPVALDRDTTSSRRHAQITDSGGAYHIQDLGSANGTFVNGAKVTDSPLSPGDEISIGGTRFRFEA